LVYDIRFSLRTHAIISVQKYDFKTEKLSLGLYLDSFPTRKEQKQQTIRAQLASYKDQD
jgi:hypothetical protein